MTDQYACLECGFVHDGTKTKKIRIDQKEEHINGRMHSFTNPELHGWEIYRICPKCGKEQKIGWVKA